jgi:hypothetical protein
MLWNRYIVRLLCDPKSPCIALIIRNENFQIYCSDGLEFIENCMISLFKPVAMHAEAEEAIMTNVGICFKCFYLEYLRIYIFNVFL